MKSALLTLAAIAAASAQEFPQEQAPGPEFQEQDPEIQITEEPIQDITQDPFVEDEFADQTDQTDETVQQEETEDDVDEEVEDDVEEEDTEDVEDEEDDTEEDIEGDEPSEDVAAIISVLEDATELEVLPELLTAFPEVVEPLVGDDDGFTVFAPEDGPLDEASADLSEEEAIEVLQYHAASDPVNPDDLENGDSVVVETSLTTEGLDDNSQVVIVSKDDEGTVTISYGVDFVTVVDPINEGDNFFHVLDGVLIPPGLASEALEEVDEEVSSLVDALVEEDLVETVDTTPQITIFAPNDAAFSEADLEDADVASILSYHVVEGVAYSPELSTNQYVSLEGRTVQVEVDDDGNVTVNGANVLVADILTENGVIHIIDTVLDPEDGEEPDGDEVTRDDEGEDDGDDDADGISTGAGAQLYASYIATAVVAGVALLA